MIVRAVVTSRFSVNPSIGGLVLSYILGIVQMIQFTVRQLAEVENDMNATERIHYYAENLDQEAPLKLKDVRDSWPERTRPARADQAPRTRPGTVSRASSEVAPWRYTGTPADPAPISQSWPIPLSAGPPWSGQRPGMARERTRHGSRDRK